VSLNWKIYTGETTGYQIYKSTTGVPGSFTLVTSTPATLSPAAATYTVTGLTNGTKYYFYIQAVSLNSQSLTASATPKGL
jgi:hypothetical protein